MGEKDSKIIFSPFISTYFFIGKPQGLIPLSVKLFKVKGDFRE